MLVSIDFGGEGRRKRISYAGGGDDGPCAVYTYRLMTAYAPGIFISISCRADPPVRMIPQISLDTYAPTYLTHAICFHARLNLYGSKHLPASPLPPFAGFSHQPLADYPSATPPVPSRNRHHSFFPRIPPNSCSSTFLIRCHFAGIQELPPRPALLGEGYPFEADGWG